MGSLHDKSPPVIALHSLVKDKHASINAHEAFNPESMLLLLHLVRENPTAGPSRFLEQR